MAVIEVLIQYHERQRPWLKKEAREFIADLYQKSNKPQTGKWTMDFIHRPIGGDSWQPYLCVTFTDLDDIAMLFKLGMA